MRRFYRKYEIVKTLYGQIIEKKNECFFLISNFKWSITFYISLKKNQLEKL